MATLRERLAQARARAEGSAKENAQETALTSTGGNTNGNNIIHSGPSAGKIPVIPQVQERDAETLQGSERKAEVLRESSQAPIAPLGPLGPIKIRLHATPTATPTPAPVPSTPSAAAPATRRIISAPQVKFTSSTVKLSAQAAEALGKTPDCKSVADALLSDWPSVLSDTESNSLDRQAQRDQLIKAAVDELEHKFAHQLHDLQLAEALDQPIVQLSQIVKLTFLRVKESPASLHMLADESVTALVKALRLLAEKRKESLMNKAGSKGSTRKASDDAFALLNAKAEYGDEAFDMDTDLDFGFGL